MKRLGLLLVFSLATGALAAVAHGRSSHGEGSQHAPRDSHSSPYAGQHRRALKSLSEEDVAQLRAGAGWGFAKAAELNGYPGPLHVLELDEALGLSGEQRERVTEVFDHMKRRAVELGHAFLAAESALDELFASGSATARELSELTGRAAALRGELRAVHLAAHLETLPLLTPHQRHRYAELRGYSTSADGSHQHGAHKHGH